MEITLKKYREDTRRSRCYKVEPNAYGVEGNIFIPKELDTPDEIKVEIKDPVVTL